MPFELPPRWRRLLKDAVASALSHTRTLTSLAPVGRSSRPLVICYHRVVDDFEQAAATDMPTMLVSREMFERHVEWIGRHGRASSGTDWRLILALQPNRR